MLAELLTITEVRGRAPIKPEILFPIPWAINSLFEFTDPFCGTNLSIASKLNKVSMLATIANVKTIIQNPWLFIKLKSGNIKFVFKSLKLLIFGRLTKCFELI